MDLGQLGAAGADRAAHGVVRVPRPERRDQEESSARRATRVVVEQLVERVRADQPARRARVDRVRARLAAGRLDREDVYLSAAARLLADA